MKRLFKIFKQYKTSAILAPTFKLFEALLELLIPIIVASIINKGIAEKDTSYVIQMIIVMVICGIVGLVFSIFGQFFSAKASVGFSTKIRHELFEKLQTLTFTDIDNLGTSSMITRLTYDVNQVQTGINLTLRLLLRSPFVVFGAAILASILLPSNAYLFWISILILSIVIFCILLFSLPLHKKAQNNLDCVLSKTKENLQGVRVIRAFGVEDSEIDNYDIQVKKLESSQNLVSNLSSLMNPITYVIVNITITLIIYMGGEKVFDGTIQQGTLIAIYNYMTQILVELIKLANLIITVSKAIASSKRIASILEMKSTIEIQDKKKIDKLPYIVFDHVNLKYQNASLESLTDLNFTVDKGDTIGIIGGTGSGKTSLVNLLTRFYDVTTGNLYLDGYDIKSYDPKELRDRVGFVVQRSILFKGTIRDNIRWGNPSATDQDIMEALKVAQALDVVNKKSHKLDEEVEQNGRNFSGGERQRLAIARALVKKPEIIVLDDSSSALDYATDRALREAIQDLSYHPTIFIVTQRTVSIQNAKKIIVLDDGKIVGLGTHQDLLQNCEVYQEIYNSQFKKEVNHE